MKRKSYRVSVDGTGARTAFAWNSAIRASEAMIRDLARAEGATYTGDAPTVTREGELAVYTRSWTSSKHRQRFANVSGPADGLRIAGVTA